MKREIFKKKGLLFSASMMMFSLGMTSCENDEDFVSSENKETCVYESHVGNLPETDEKENLNDSIGIFQFTYKGREYTSSCVYTDSVIYIKNAFVRSVYESLKAMKNVAIFVNDDMTIEFYDSEQDMREIKRKNILQTRANTQVAHYIKNFRIRVYDKAKGRKRGGAYLELTSNGIQGDKSPAPLYVSVNDLSAVGLNKSISSSETWITEIGEQINPTALLEGQYLHATITFYENGNFTGRSLTFTEMSINYTHSQIDAFGDFDFNDATSSFKVVYDNIM